MSFIKIMNASMRYMSTNGKPLKKRGNSCQPVMSSWGIGEGIPPLTDDPENPIKPFATYEEGSDDERRN